MNPSVRYNFVRTRQLEGTFREGSHLGAWMVSSNRVLFGWGQVPEGLWPYFRGPEDFHSPEPMGLDLVAKHYRISGYSRVRSAADCLRVLKLNRRIIRAAASRRTIPYPGSPLLVKVAFEYTRQFLRAPRGIVWEPPPGAPILGSHSVPVYRYSASQKWFEFMNSWGPGWGDHGWGYMPYDFVDRWVVDSWAIDDRPARLPEGHGVITETREQPDIAGRRSFVIETYDADSDERIGWAFAVARDGAMEIEELFVRPQFRRRGHGARLVEHLRRIAADTELPLRAWVPFADAYPENRPALAAILGRLGLGVRRSGVRWAAYLGTTEVAPGDTFPLIRMPERPAGKAEESSPGSGLAGIDTLRGTVLHYEDPFGPAIPPEEWDAAT